MRKARCLAGTASTVVLALISVCCAFSPPVAASPSDPVLVLPRFHDEYVRPVISPDGSLLAVPATMGAVLVFHPDTGEVVRTLTGLTGGWRDVAFTPDGQYLLGAMETSSRVSARIWRTSNWSLYREVTASLPHWLRAVAISPDARWLAVGGWNYLKVYNTETGEEVANLPQPGRYVYSLAFSRDGQYLFSANGGTKAIVWRVSDWSQLAELADGLSENVALVVSADHLALADGEKVRVWRIGTWDSPQYTFNREAAFDGEIPITFSHDGSRLAARWNNDLVKVWQVSDGAEVQTIDAKGTYGSISVRGIALRNSIDLFAGVSADSRALVAHHSVTSGAKVKEIRAPISLDGAGVALSPDGSSLAVADRSREVYLLDTATFQRQLTLTGNVGAAVSFSPDGGRLFVPYLGLYSVPDGTRIWANSSYDEGVFLPDGNSLVTMRWASIWWGYFLTEAATGAETLQFAWGHGDLAYRHALVSPDSKYLLVPGRGIGMNWDTSFRVWRMATGQLVYEQSWGAFTAALHPSGNFVVAGYDYGYLDLKSVNDTGDTLEFTNIHSWNGHSNSRGNAVRRIAFAPSGYVFVSGAEDSTVKVWRFADLGLERTLYGHTEPVYTVAVAQQGNDLLVAAAGWGGAALWRIPNPGMGNAPVSAPQLLYPAPNAELPDWMLSFKSTDSDVSDQLRFRVEILSTDGTVVKTYDQSRDPAPFDKPYASSDEVVSVTIDPDLPLGTYRWRVRATDGWSWSAWSEERVFTLVKPVLPLGQFRTLQVNAAGVRRFIVNVPEGSGKLFVTCRSVEQKISHKLELYKNGTKIVEQADGNVLIDRTSPEAGEYELVLTPAAAGAVVLYAGTSLPSVRLAGTYTGTIYHNDGYDWIQLDVPAGVRALNFTVDAPGNVTELDVWRDSIGSWYRWSARQSFNPPVRLTINNPQAGRYYIRVMDHGSLQQTQVRQYTLSLSGARANLSADATPAIISAGSPDPISYSITYANEGDAPAIGAVLKCVLPEGLTPVEGSISEGGTYDASTRTITWDLGDLGAGAIGTASLQATVSAGVPEATNLKVQVKLQSAELPEEAVKEVAVWVGAAGVTFDNVYTLYNDVNVTIGGLSIDRAQGTPRVSLVFPPGMASAVEVPAEEVTVSEDGSRVEARFALFDKVLQDVAPVLRLSHPSTGDKEWQGPTLQVFGMHADVSYNKSFVRMGRQERFTVTVTNPTSQYQTPIVKFTMPLENVPSDENPQVTYVVTDNQGREVQRGAVNVRDSREVVALMPPLAPQGTANYTLTLKVTSDRSAPRTRIEPMTIAVVFVVSEVAIIGAWAGHHILQSGCEKAIKRRLREDLADAGHDLSDEQLNRLYNAYKQTGSFMSAWLSEIAAGATEQAFKDWVKAKYGEQFLDAAETTYKAAKGDHPMDIAFNLIASKLADGLDWPLLPATSAIKAFLAEGQNCIETREQFRQIVKRINQKKQTNRLRITRAWDPNAKSGSFGVDGFLAGGESIDYTVFFENQPTATASAEEVLIEDILDANLDETTLEFTAFGFGSNDIRLSAPVRALSQGVDLGNNLVVRVESSYDPATRKLTVRFRGIDTRTGEHHENGFLPPNVNEPEGEGYVSFRIQPKADTPSGTRIVNTATILFDPHLGGNPPMTTNEHAVTIDKQSPAVTVRNLREVEPKPRFRVEWEGADDASGIEGTEIWYSENGGPFQLWQVLQPGETRSDIGSSMFAGKFGYTYRFYAVARDRVNNRSDHPSSPQTSTTAGAAPTIPAGLQLIALPVVSEDADARRVLNFEADKLAGYASGTGYVRYPNTSLGVGRGYWVQMPNAQVPSIRGEVPDDAAPLTIPLQQGWNLIGNPWLENLTWDLSAIQVELGGQTKSLAEAQSAGWVEDYAWGWNGSRYVLVYDASVVPGVSSQMQAWRGYWVYAHQACNLVLPSPSSASALSRSRRAGSGSGGWSFPVRLQYGSASDEVTVGIASGRGMTIGLPPAPFASSAPKAKLSIVQSQQAYAVDVRRSSGKQTWQLRAEWAPSEQSDVPVVITFGNVASVPRGTALWLVDESTGKRHYVRTTASYRFTPAPGETSRMFQMVAELETGIGLRITSVSVTRTRGGSFSVAFHLTQPAAVTAEVKDASGRIVSRLNPFGGRAVEGLQSLTWRATDDQGVSLPAGAYLLQLQAVDADGRQTRVNVPLVLTR